RRRSSPSSRLTENVPKSDTCWNPPPFAACSKSRSPCPRRPEEKGGDRKPREYTFSMTVLEAGEKHKELLDELLADVEAYNPDVDRELVARAFRFAAEAHEGQQRRSGEPFIRHPWGSAKILAELRQD